MDNLIKVSFCIPSLNRPKYLLNAIESICNQTGFNQDIEICIFNNCSDTSYFDVENIINVFSSQYNIYYSKGLVRLEIDQSMHEVIKMAKGNFLFLLGDDDFLLPNSLKVIIDLINKDKFDLVIFNAIILNEKNKTKARMFNSKKSVLLDLNEVLLEFKNYCSYGNILIKSEFIRSDDFKYLEGTSHAYGCFWLAFFRLYEKGLQPRVIISNRHVVCLRAILKTYNLLQVTFEHSQKEFSLYYKAIGEKSTEILKGYENSFWKDQSRFFKLLQYGLAGNDLSKISSYNYVFYNDYVIKITFAKIFAYFLKPFKTTLKYFFITFKKIHV
ncbi:glycosyltransferase family 2 protein [Flavobacterium gawalongense]|uniref:Glycosyltransferase family 2 protein n=1 Tax=Flavobacterium gawalongense TaxID=2594432 RepID=A0ABY3CQ24_9FLAO|nr:glycosyltransferase family 2 protein [Flavobacterium gawalongense]TRX04452.1 glycosyltransferase family 2 protein [Flavobacterium gawalongense]TRX10341.1 glycosyltransferase family 2 protein [Flavobacterium gawalongense]